MYNTYIVKRTQIYVDEFQDRRLTKRAAAAGVTKSTLIREAIEAYLGGGDEERERLARFRSAVEEASRAPLKLSPGKRYVEELRRADRRRQGRLEQRRRS